MLDKPENRARLRRKLEQWPDGKESPVTINDGLELLDMVERLEKEADWLANKLADEGGLIIDPPCGADCNPCDLPCRQEEWREAARKSVEQDNASNHSRKN